jgi:poly(3-hydroxybutyrate) depolymerase
MRGNLPQGALWNRPRWRWFREATRGGQFEVTVGKLCPKNGVPHFGRPQKRECASMRTHLRHKFGWAAILSWATVAAGAFQEAQPGKQAPFTFEKEIKVTVRLQYLLYLPPEYKPEGPRWPLLVFLHGAGESGDNIELVKRHGPPKLIEQGKHFPFVVLSPQSPGFGWNVDAVAALIDEIVAGYHVDPDRVYLTGLSMGGFGTWSLASRYPSKFAAIAPICGGGDPRWAESLKELPIWVFHGAKDPVVPLERSERMVEALKKLGADVRFTVYPEAGHDSWTETYNNPELYQWFLQHQRKAKPTARAQSR